jgi:hypothetical protein
MDAFFLSSVISFVITSLLLASSATRRGKTITLRIGNALTLRAVRSAFVFSVLVGSIGLLLLLVLLILGRLHPPEGSIYSWSDFISGRVFSSLIFGLLFGALFAFWLRDLLLLKPTRKVGWKPVVQSVLLAILLFFGAFSDILVSYAYRISQFSVGGAQVSFTPLREGDRDGRGQPGTAAQPPANTKGKSEEALGLVADMAERISRDQDYIDFFAGLAKSGAANTRENPHANFHRNTLGPLAQCLAGVGKVSADETVIDEYLRETVAQLREIVIARDRLPKWRRPEVVKYWLNNSANLVKHLNETYLQLDEKDTKRTEILSKCAELIEQTCLLEGSLEYGLPSRADLVAADCRDKFDEDSRQTFVASRTNELAGQLDKLLGDKALFDRPYMALLYAGVSWRLNQHLTATHELDAWLKEATSAHPWHRARARFQISVILEDLIRTSGYQPGSVYEYHLNNLMQNIEAMRPMLEKVLGRIGEGSDTSSTFDQVPTRSSKCQRLTLNELRLANTFFSQQLVYIFNALKMPTYYENYSLQVMKYRDALSKTSLSCLQSDYLAANDAELQDYQREWRIFYAEVLQAFGEIDLVHARRILLLPDRDAAKRNLRRVVKIADLGGRLIRRYAEDDRRAARSEAYFTAQIAGKNTYDLESRFKAMRETALAQLRSL